MTKYKIEGHNGHGNWSDEYVGDQGNEFDSEAEAEASIPTLVEIFNAQDNPDEPYTEDDFRVVRID